MNAFFDHHKDSIRFAYRCFDRILLNATIQPFQQEQRAVGFFWSYRHIDPVSRDLLRGIAHEYHNWVKNRSQRWGVPIQEDPKEDAMILCSPTSAVLNQIESWSSSKRASRLPS